MSSTGRISSTRVGRSKLVKMVSEASLIGMVNWTMLPYLTQLWQMMHKGSAAWRKIPRQILLRRFVRPTQTQPGGFAESDEGSARPMRANIKVVLGLNLSEAVQVAAVLGIPAYSDAESQIKADGEGHSPEDENPLHCDSPASVPCMTATEDETACMGGPFVPQA